MIRIYLVDDQNLVREGLKSLLSLIDDIDVAGEAADGAAAVEEIPSIRPDLLLLDLRMPGMDGVEILRALEALDALPPPLILTTFDDDVMLLETIRAGAKGFLLKDASLEAGVNNQPACFYGLAPPETSAFGYNGSFYYEGPD